MDISVITPVFNEEDSIQPLYSEIKDVLDQNFEDWEIIMVDDGSKDNSWKIMNQLEDQDNRLKLVKLRKNFGQSSAIQAGLETSKGDLIATMDSDMQNDPNDIPKLVDELGKGYDLVNGWRKNRKDPLKKKFFSRIASIMRKLLLGSELNDYGCTLKVMTREAADELSINGEMHRYIPPILESRGFKTSELPVNHRKRHSGKTKYGLLRIPKGFMDMINLWFWQRYRDRPLHIFGSLGILSISLGLFTGLIAFYQKLNGVGLSDTAATIISPFLIMIGVQFFISGLLADIVVRNYYRKSGNKNYRVQKVVG